MTSQKLISFPLHAMCCGLANRRSLHKEEQRFEYDTLRGGDNTRIITLLPGTSSDDLCCQLEAVDVTEVENAYEAISYIWGNPEQTVDITCNGRRVSVTTNLADALRAIRDLENPKRLWADAICINQNDDEEKSHQVKRMGDVYKNAKGVLVWLGYDKESIAEDCFNLIQETNRYMDEQLEKHVDHQDIPALVEPYPICVDKARWAKVNKLIALPWFKRVWVIQEAGLAKACVLLWGQHRLDIAELVELVIWKSYRRDLSELTKVSGTGFLNDLFSDVHCTYKNVETWRESKPLMRSKSQQVADRENLFIDTLVAGSGLSAFDDRDHVYALLGSPLARQSGGQLLVEPDYGKKLHEVYFETACGLLQNPREAPYVLARVKHRSIDEVANRTFPSWIPRWDKGLIPFTISRPWFWYKAGGLDRFQAEVRKDKRLALRGFVFDCLSWTSRILSEHNFRVDPSEWDDEFRSAREPFIESLWNDAVQASSSSAEQLEDQFSYTLARGYPADVYRKITMLQHQAEFTAYRHLVHTAADSSLRQALEDVQTSEEQAYPLNFLHRISYCAGLRLALTGKNRLGLVSNIAQPGDTCCIFLGMSVPMLLRRTSQGIYRLIGECYFHGIMGGEEVEQLKKGKFKEEIIIIE